jgi:hypothetical protein
VLMPLAATNILTYLPDADHQQKEGASVVFGVAE